MDGSPGRQPAAKPGTLWPKQHREHQSSLPYDKPTLETGPSCRHECSVRPPISSAAQPVMAASATWQGASVLERIGSGRIGVESSSRGGLATATKRQRLYA